MIARSVVIKDGSGFVFVALFNGGMAEENPYSIGLAIINDLYDSALQGALYRIASSCCQQRNAKSLKIDRIYIFGVMVEGNCNDPPVCHNSKP